MNAHCSLLFALGLLLPRLGAAAEDELIPVPAPETQPTWDEAWAHPDAAEDLPGFDETLGPSRPAPDAGAPAPAPVPADGQPLFDALSGLAPAVETAPAPPPLEEALAKARRTGVSWDFQVELGATLAATFWDYDHFAVDDWSFIKNPGFPIFARARAGLLVLQEPWYLGIGPSVSYGGVGEWAVGGQVELTNIWGGVWAQGEMAGTFKGDLVASIAAGYQIFGVELKAGNGGRDVAVIFKVRAPIGLMVFVRGFLDRRPPG